MTETAAGGMGRHALLVVSSTPHTTASDRKPIPALLRFTSALFSNLQLMQKKGEWPTDVEIVIYHPPLGFVRADDLIGPINEGERATPEQLHRNYEEFGNLLEKYTNVRLALVDHHWVLFKNHRELDRSDLEVVRITGYTSEKLRKIRYWLDKLS